MYSSLENYCVDVSAREGVEGGGWSYRENKKEKRWKRDVSSFQTVFTEIHFL